MVGGFATTWGFKALIVTLMAVVVITPVAFLVAAIWLVFFKFELLTLRQLIVAMLVQLAAYIAFLVIYHIASNPQNAG